MCNSASLEIPLVPWQANVDPRQPYEDWPLESLANKMKQYCPQLKDLDETQLRQVPLESILPGRTSDPLKIGPP